MTTIESAANISDIIPTISILPESTTAEEVNDKSLFRLRNLIIGVTLSLAATGVAHPEHTEDYARLAQANIQHLVSDALSDTQPDIKSLDYLDQFEVSNGLFMDGRVGNYAPVWPYSQALSAFYITSLIPGHEKEYSEKFRTGLEAANKYWGLGPDGSRYGYNATTNTAPFDDKERFVDDNLWMGLIHMQAFRASNNPQDLDRAKQIFDIALYQWDEHKGGIYWQVQWPGAQNHSRALVSNAPTVQLAVALYQQTGEERYWSAAQEIFEWMKVLQDTRHGFFHDHINDDESYGTNKYTYGQAVAASAMAAMNEVDPNKYPLQDAIDLASTSLDHLESEGLLGNPAFDAIFFRVVFGIAANYDSPEFSAKVSQTLDNIVSELPSRPTKLLDAAGAEQLIAMQSVPPEAYSKLF